MTWKYHKHRRKSLWTFPVFPTLFSIYITKLVLLIVQKSKGQKKSDFQWYMATKSKPFLYWKYIYIADKRLIEISNNRKEAYILLKICLGSLFCSMIKCSKQIDWQKDFFYKDRLIFGLDDPVANMSIRHVYYAWGAREKTYPLKRVSFCLVSSSALIHLANFQLSYHKF